MKFAIVDHKKVEATKGATGICPSCNSELVAHCGEKKVHHWAHKGVRNCDPWWENETLWHRSWKGNFPNEWQEVVHKAEDGEKHIADIKTPEGWAIEFQHSYLKPEERRSRDAFYSNLVWVVDGMRRERDKKKFQEAIDDGSKISQSPPIFKLHFPDECRIINEWFSSPNMVFFDFRTTQNDDFNQGLDLFDTNLWFLIPVLPGSVAYISYLPHEVFIQFHKKRNFEDVFISQIKQIQQQLIKRHSTLKKRTRIILPRNIIPNHELRRRNRRF